MNILLRWIVSSIVLLSILLGFTSSTGLASPAQSAKRAIIDYGDDLEATGNRVLISPFDSDGEVTVKLGQTAYTKFGWIACSKGLVLDAYQASVVKLVVKRKGNIIQRIAGKNAKSKWRKTTSLSGDTSYCVWPVSSWFGKTWKFSNFKFDRVGTYKVIFYWAFKYAVIDGGDYVGNDGIPEYFVGPRGAKFDNGVITVYVVK